MRHFACAAILALLPSLALAQEKTVPTPANVKIEGMPPIPQSIVDGLGALRAVPAGATAWRGIRRSGRSSSRRPSATVAAAPSRRWSRPRPPPVDVVAVAGRVRLRRAPRSIRRTGTRSCSSTIRAGGELRSLYRYDLTTGEASLVVESKIRYCARVVAAGQVARLRLGRAQRQRPRSLRHPAVRSEDETPACRLRRAHTALSDWSPDGTTLLVSEVVGNAETYLWRVDVEDRCRRQRITPRDGRQEPAGSTRDSRADGKTVYAMSDRASRRRCASGAATSPRARGRP